jgi:ribosomal protein S18 acetylase RimI-like enzyme
VVDVQDMAWTFANPAGAIEVTPARLEDAPAILALHREVLGERDWFITLPGELHGAIDQKIRQIREFERSPNSVFLVARRGDAIVGFLTVQGGVLGRMRHCGKLEVMVRREARNAGIGKALLAACLDWAQANPVLIKLGLSVFADNERAIALYRTHGFLEEGHRPAEYRDEDGTLRDDLLMYRFVKPVG